MRDVLKVSTAGSVDDGKSTLIGRLLFETHNIPKDQMAQLKDADGGWDYARVTDGLRAEREQGITIDVAFRYLNTPERRIVLADSPGHAQYTRNMATAASDSDCAVILVDAQRGIREQSRRHALIAVTMHIPHLIVVINKMDLVAYDADRFNQLTVEFDQMLNTLGSNKPRYIPVSALHGDYVVQRSNRMSWYSGPTLLESLQAVPVRERENTQAFRLPIQLVARTHGFRGISGTIASGRLAVGDNVMVLPAQNQARIASIHTARGNPDRVHADTAVTVTFDREIDAGRGDLLVHAHDQPKLAHSFDARIVWFSDTPLQPGDQVIIRRATNSSAASVTHIYDVTDLATSANLPATRIQLNELGQVRIRLNQRMALDRYEENRTTGSFIIISPRDNQTLAAGMVMQLEDPATVKETPSLLIHTAGEPSSLTQLLTVQLQRTRRASLVLDGHSHPLAADRSIAQLGIIPIWVNPPAGLDAELALSIRYSNLGRDEPKTLTGARELTINQDLVGPEEAALLIAQYVAVEVDHE